MYPSGGTASSAVGEAGRRNENLEDFICSSVGAGEGVSPAAAGAAGGADGAFCADGDFFLNSLMV